MVDQRMARIGDWTICQDKTTTKASIRTNSIDAFNTLNVLDWAIADFKSGNKVPCIYVPNRVYAMDTVILKQTLEGLMPIPENLDGNCHFETVSEQTLILTRTSGEYTCSNSCPKRWPPTSCEYYSATTKYSSPTCPHYSGGVMIALGVGIRGAKGIIDFRIYAKSAFEYLDIRISDWPRLYTELDGMAIRERDEIGWVPGESPGETFSYQKLDDNVVRIWAFPGGGTSGGFGPAGTNAKIRVVFTLLGEYLDTDLVWSGTFPETTRNVSVSYVGAGRRGNHR